MYFDLACDKSGGHSRSDRIHTPDKCGFMVYRHNVAVVYPIADAVSSIRGTRVDVNPRTMDPNSQRANDLLIYGSQALGEVMTEHDVKVYSLFGSGVPSTIDPFKDSQLSKAPNPNNSQWKQAQHQIDRYLHRIGERTRRRAPGGTGRFSALVFSSGALVEKETMKELSGWMEKMDKHTKNWMATRISIGFVKAQARSYET